MQNDKAITVSQITKKFGAVTAVDGIDFEVPRGEFFGFLGPNGAGKTTLIRMLTTILKPTSGQAIVSGFDVAKAPGEVRKHIGVVPQASTSDLDLTGRENMDLYGRFYGIKASERKQRIKTLLDTVGLAQRADDLVATYSGGMRRRLEIARVLVHSPALLFLDEPTIGLDPQSRRVVWDFLRKLTENAVMTIFLTTHYMDEAESLCGRVAIIDTGKIIALGSPAELKANIPGNDIITLALGKAAPPDIVEAVEKLPFAHKIKPEEGGEIRVYVDNGPKDLPALIDAVRAAGGEITSASVHEQSLEDVFIHYTGKSIREEEAKKVSFFIGAGLPQRLGR
ncbi:MAG: ATP-binding cassette domain-containing protein [Nitrospiraceae bacterium]|nr:ATP-binding cassette domain-containing protein [Nitrospiraceae bacterium]